MLIRRSIPDVVFTCEEAGEAFAHAADCQQRDFLIAMCNATDMMDMRGGSWLKQCHAIVNGPLGHGNGTGLSESDRRRIASMLNCLMDFLTEVK